MRIAGFQFTTPQTWPERLTETPMPEAKRDTIANVTVLSQAGLSVGANLAAPRKQRGNIGNMRPNRKGAPSRMRRGARGIAGLRADLRDDRITNREIAMMSDRELAARYRIKPPSVWRLRDAVNLYEGGTPYRHMDGTLRAVPLVAPHRSILNALSAHSDTRA